MCASSFFLTVVEERETPYTGHQLAFKMQIGLLINFVAKVCSSKE